jgi:hypothetical protein
MSVGVMEDYKLRDLLLGRVSVDGEMKKKRSSLVIKLKPLGRVRSREKTDPKT